MTITAALVNELRQKTGAGMMDCKKALVETNGNIDEATDILRKKGLASAAKKSDRVAAEGLVVVSVKEKEGVVLELSSETDFVAKNDKFQALAHTLAHDYLNQGADKSFEDFKSSNEQKVTEHIALIGENIMIRRATKLSVPQGLVVSYTHNAIAPSLGKIGVLVAFESNIAPEKLAELGKQIAMHVAAAKPEALTSTELDPKLIAKEREIAADQARASGKPENVIEKMVEGRIQKFYEQVVLLEQLFVMDGKTKISQLLADFAKQHGGTINIKAYVRFVLGEGIEKQESNLAAEVAAMTASK